MKRYFKFPNSILELDMENQAIVFDTTEYRLYPIPEKGSMRYSWHFLENYADKKEITKEEFDKWKKEWDFLYMRKQQFVEQIEEHLKEIGFHK